MWRCRRTPLEKQLARLERKLNKIVSDQDVLNAYVARVNAAVSAVSAEITALKGQVSVPLDFSGLDTAVAAFEALEPPVVTPPASS